ncbi:hypothetical protein P8C59_000894 [Phyllachora maydis]|uniref:Uncharacterized protein n=1 Tax=Phyllachora maydis TaxID=1825666 RepID=A0AAD9HY72_9PEZI|nr:hypothetical protein P8C59_000894 [Phyllachora maydis]
MADQAKGKGIALKRASNPADPGQSSRPLPPIRTLLEDKEDGEDYSEVIEVLKQHIKSYKRDSVSAIKNISSTLASLTNSSNAVAATIGKTSYSPRFDPFSGTIDLDSPPRPPRKEPYLGPAVDNTATSNLDPPIDTGSKEGFKDTITSSIVKELSKKAYTIPDDSKLSGESNFEQWIQALTVLLMLLRDSLSSGPRAAISWIHIPSKAFKLLVRQYSRPIESKKEDVYNEFHALTFSTYRKGLSAFNAEFNGYLAKLTMAKIDIDPSLILNQYFKALESKFPSWVSRQKSSIRQARMLGLTASSLNKEYLMADFLEESRNPATEAPLTTTSTTIVDSRNGKGSSRTSIINSSLVPIGFSDSDFTGDKATTSGPISWKTKRATTIALSTLEAETDGLIEAIREVQWIIGLFSELYRPIDHPITLYGDNQGSITVANDPALHARTKYTLLKFQYVREQLKAKIVTIIYLNTKSSKRPTRPTKIESSRPIGP